MESDQPGIKFIAVIRRFTKKLPVAKTTFNHLAELYSPTQTFGLLDTFYGAFAIRADINH